MARRKTFTYWSEAELRAFLLSHGLVIASGVADEDDVAPSARGAELAAYLRQMVIDEREEKAQGR